MKNNNKQEQLLLRLNQSLKEDLRKKAEQTGLSMSSYVIKKLEGDSLNTQLFSEIQRENKELKEQLSDLFFYIKKDLDEIKENQTTQTTTETTKKEDKNISYKKEKSLNFEDINSYKIGDIVDLEKEFIVITSISREEEIITGMFLTSGETKRFNIKNNHSYIKSIIKKS